MFKQVFFHKIKFHIWKILDRIARITSLTCYVYYRIIDSIVWGWLFNGMLIASTHQMRSGLGLVCLGLYRSFFKRIPMLIGKYRCIGDSEWIGLVAPRSGEDDLVVVLVVVGSTPVKLRCNFLMKLKRIWNKIVKSDRCMNKYILQSVIARSSFLDF